MIIKLVIDTSKSTVTNVTVSECSYSENWDGTSFYSSTNYHGLNMVMNGLVRAGNWWYRKNR